VQATLLEKNDITLRVVLRLMHLKTHMQLYSMAVALWQAWDEISFKRYFITFIYFKSQRYVLLKLSDGFIENFCSNQCANKVDKNHAILKNANLPQHCKCSLILFHFTTFL